MATQGEIGKPNANEILPPMMPIALKKQNSGSGTFTDSVFQVLHEELFTSLTMMKEEARLDVKPSTTPVFAAMDSSDDIKSATSSKKTSKKSKPKKR